MTVTTLQLSSIGRRGNPQPTRPLNCFAVLTYVIGDTGCRIVMLSLLGYANERKVSRLYIREVIRSVGNDNGIIPKRSVCYMLFILMKITLLIKSTIIMVGRNFCTHISSIFKCKCNLQVFQNPQYQLLGLFLRLKVWNIFSIQIS